MSCCPECVRTPSMVPSPSYIQFDGGAKIGIFPPSNPEGTPSRPPRSTVRLTIRKSESELLQSWHQLLSLPTLNSEPFATGNSQRCIHFMLFPNPEPEWFANQKFPTVAPTFHSSRTPNFEPFSIRNQESGLSPAYSAFHRPFRTLNDSEVGDPSIRRLNLMAVPQLESTIQRR